MSTILCATDFSSAAGQAADIAASLARAFGDSLELLHVVDVRPVERPELMSALIGSLRAAAEAELDRWVDRLANKDLAVHGRIELGIADETILARAQILGPRLLVLGNHGRRGLRRFLGSVAERMVHRARCPVLVVPETVASMRTWRPGSRPLKVTAGIDLSPGSEAALRMLATLDRATACELDLVHVFAPAPEHERLGLAWSPEIGKVDPWVSTVLERELRACVDRSLEAIEDAPQVRLRPAGNDDSEALAEEAKLQEADLLVLGNNRRRDGSTAIATLRVAERPVLCVPAPDAAQGPAEAMLPPVRTALVATDFSALANAAIPEAYRLLPRGGTVVICHVADPGPAGLDPQVRAELERSLAALVPAWAKGAGLRTHTVVHESGSPSEGLVQVCRRLGADFVVISSHGRSGLRRTLLGSVAEAVVRAAPAPVLVVPSRDRPAG